MTAPGAGLAAKHNQARALVAQMTLEEKASLCSGRNFWFLKGCERLGLSSVMVTDGPHGLRKQAGRSDQAGLDASVPATCFPTACALASSWDVDLLRAVGGALGEQCAVEQVAVLLGPGMNIKRHPLCGRNFEYFSEDPLLSGELAAALVDGIQSRGVGACLKHFAVNNQEKARMSVDAVVDPRTLREIYLRGFEIAVRKAQPWTVMCAYNRLNGHYCAEHTWLLDDVLRGEWGFEGVVVSDWGATNDRVRGVAGGLDLEMPASGGMNDRRIVEAVSAGELSEAVLDRTVVRVVSLILLGMDGLEASEGGAAGSAVPPSTAPAGPAPAASAAPRLDVEAHHALARRAAAESAVLLTNREGLLPLLRDARIAVIGAFARAPRYQGAGSSQVRPTRLDCALDAISALATDPSLVTYAAGYDPRHSQADPELIEDAVAAAAAAEVAVVFAGLPAIYESEGFDRAHLGLPEQHDRLIEAVCRANPRTVVVLANGAPVQMPWIRLPGAVLETYLAGQAGGGAVAELLFGIANPSGKLAESFPLALSDVPSQSWFPGSGRQVQYREGLYVGYRYYDTAGTAVAFPFGHGLSYTDFEFAGLKLSGAVLEPGRDASAVPVLRLADDDVITVVLSVTNVGAVAGAEVVQLYVHDEACSAYRPEQELKAFGKVRLEPGETRRLRLDLERSAFAYWDAGSEDWVVEPGIFEIRVGGSSRDIRLRARVDVRDAFGAAGSASAGGSDAAAPGPTLAEGGIVCTDETFAAMLRYAIPPPDPVRPFHLNSTLAEIGQTWLGARLRSRLVKQFQARMGAGTRDETLQKMFEEMANDMPLRALALFSGGRLSFEAVQALVALLNGRYRQALRIWRRRNGGPGRQRLSP